MQFKWKTRRTSIGLDLGTQIIKAAQFNVRGNDLEIAAALVVPRPTPDTSMTERLAEWVGGLLRRHGFTGSELVLTAPPQSLKTDVLDLPPRSSGAPIELIARDEMSRSCAWEKGTFEFGCWELPSPARGSASTCMMAVALREQDATELIEPLEAVGLDVVAIEPQVNALVRLIDTTESDTITAVLDLGMSSSTLVLSHRNLPLYQRRADLLGMGTALRTIMDELQLPADEADYLMREYGVQDPSFNRRKDDHASARIQQFTRRYLDALLSEVQSAFTFARHRYPTLPVAKLILCGGGASVSGVADAMAEELEKPVEVLTIPGAHAISATVPELAQSGILATAAGLAMRGRR